jgi:hypothetical protein
LPRKKIGHPKRVVCPTPYGKDPLRLLPGGPGQLSAASCWGPRSYVDLSLEEVNRDEFDVYPPRVGVMAYRQRPTQAPSVYVHLHAIEMCLGGWRNTVDQAVHTKPSRSSKQRVHRHHHRRYRQRSPHHTAGDPAHVPAPPRLHADGISTPVRLHHADRELLRSDPRTTKVTTIAAKWGLHTPDVSPLPTATSTAKART